MKIMLKSLLAVSLTLVAHANNQARPVSSVNMKHNTQHQSMDPNPTARWGTSDDQNVFLTGEVVWFRPTQCLPANFQPAARVALGYNTPFDGWDAVLVYTGLRYSHKAEYENFDPADPSTNDYTLKANYNVGDADLGRMFKISERLKVRPHFGFRGLWLSNTTLDDSTPTNSYETKYQMYGGEIGCETYWKLAKEFSLYANIGYATLVSTQNFYINSTEYNNFNDYVDMQFKYAGMTNQFDFQLGLRWDKNFSDDAYHFSINAGYEHHILTTYGLDYQDVQSVYVLNQYFGNSFNLQGIALGARFDF
jgi:hypothetical protein